MKPSDLFIRGRQFFGFLIPGVMLVGSAVMLLGQRPLGFIEGGNALLRAALFAGVSYLVGFTAQTLIFPCIADRLKSRISTERPERVMAMKGLEEQLVEIFESRLPAGKKRWEIPQGDLRSFCKLYVLERSPTLGSLLLEKENDINFMVAYIVAGPTLALTYAFSRGYSIWWIIGLVILTAFFVKYLRQRLYFYLQMEIVYAYEACLVLLLKQDEQIAKSPAQQEKNE